MPSYVLVRYIHTLIICQDPPGTSDLQPLPSNEECRLPFVGLVIVGFEVQGIVNTRKRKEARKECLRARCVHDAHKCT